MRTPPVDYLRTVWRNLKGPVVEGRSGGGRRLLYRLLQGLATRAKRHLPLTDLRETALWLMYHPETGIAPCDAWKSRGGAPCSADEIAALRRRLQVDRAKVVQRLRVEDVAIDTLRLPPPRGDLRVAVHIHDYYHDVFPRIERALGNIPVPFDLFVSSLDGVDPCPNRGRDLAPLICRYGRRLADYDVIGHFHTKRSGHAAEEGDWLGYELSSLLGSPDRVGKILALLQDGYGMVAAKDYLPMFEDPSGWQRDLPLADGVLRKIGWNLDLRRDYTPILFPQGSMFWARGDFMRTFLSLPLSFDDFPVEPIGLDGSLAHALERLLFVLGLETKLKIARLSCARLMV